jgi:hypothetical protein
VEFAGELTRHRILVDLKRVAQAVQIAPRHAEPRVDLLAPVVSRVAQREPTFGANL